MADKCSKVRAKNVTPESLFRAYIKAANAVYQGGTVASEVDAGIILPGRQEPGQRTGYQVFIKVARFSEELLTRKPETGGLLVNEPAAKGKRRKT